VQNDSGVRSLLTFPAIYSAFQRAIGADRSRKWLLREGWRVADGMRVVDIGCGPGDILNLLPHVHYVGLDISEKYIASARARYGSRATFVAGTAPSLRDIGAAQNADLVTCAGVIHHLAESEALELLGVAYELLAPGGRFVALEPTYLKHQTSTSKWIMSKDRGQAIRSESGWKSLLADSPFELVETHVITGLIRIPYTHVLIEATKEDRQLNTPSKMLRDDIREGDAKASAP
jgi:ubiquinone/menaquinone biosynthesis C-methylase UbiE